MQPLDVIVGLAGDPALELLNSRATPSQVQKERAVGAVARCGPVSRNLSPHSGAVERDA